jgi:hypothetical protein
VDFLESERDFCIDILAARAKSRCRTRSTAAAAEKTFEEATKVGRTLTCAEPVAESIKTYVGTLPSGRRSEIRTRLPVWSKLIVSFALVRIGQNLVRLIYVFEFLLG